MPKTAHNILIVDDETAFLLLCEKILSQTGHQEIKRKSGSEGMDYILNGGKASVVISDEFLEGINGVEFLSLFRKHSPNTYQILVSGKISESELYDRMINSDIDDCLAKSFDLQELLNKVKTGIKHYEEKSACNN